MRPAGKGRVAESHEIARAAFLAALLFALIAVVWSVVVLIRGGSWWGPLHSFLAGTVLLAISGASQMFTITWSSTRPLSRRVTSTQRWLILLGVAGVLAGVTLGLEVLTWAAGAAVAAGIIVLAAIIRSSIRHSLLRRFDLSARFYLTAFTCGILGVTLGTVMGAGGGGASYEKLRLAHAHLNLLGLVGLTIIGTIPTLLPTTAYSRAVTGVEGVWAWWLSLVGAGLMAVGIWAPRAVGAGATLIAVAGATIMVGIVARLWEKGRGKLAFLQIAIGSAWLIGWALVDGVSVLATGVMPHFDARTAAAVVSGVGQVLAGSLAYLIPVLRGSPFDANRRIMEARPWLPLILANAGGLALGLGLGVTALVACGLFVTDFLSRVVIVGLRRPVAEPPG